MASVHATWSSHRGAWFTPWHLPVWLLQWVCAPLSTHMAMDRAHLSFSLLSFLLFPPSLSFLPSSLSFKTETNRTKVLTFFTYPQELSWTSRQINRMDKTPSTWTISLWPRTYDFWSWGLLGLTTEFCSLHSHPFSQLITGGQKQASLQNTSNSKGQNLSPPLSHWTWSSYSALICILHAICLVDQGGSQESHRLPALCLTHTHTHTHTHTTHPPLQRTNRQVLSAFPIEIVMPY